MKKKIHPAYYDDAKVSCSCGNTFVTGSTMQEIRADVCSKCHPFYTGQVKYVDTRGRVERFQAKQKVAQKQKAVLDEKRKKKEESRKKSQEPAKTLREMLLGM